MTSGDQFIEASKQFEHYSMERGAAVDSDNSSHMWFPSEHFEDVDSPSQGFRDLEDIEGGGHSGTKTSAKERTDFDLAEAVQSREAPILGKNSRKASDLASELLWPAENIDPAVLSGSEAAGNLSAPQSVALEATPVVNMRNGVPTPPDDSVEGTSNSSPVKRSLSRSQSVEVGAFESRRRGAILGKHVDEAASKTNFQDTSMEQEVDVQEDDGEEKRHKYREKNRLAAAKCRTKKKANVNDLEERHRRMAAENKFRKHEERELRDELTNLRTMALEHRPGRCHCGGLHSYNQTKATQMAMGHRMAGPPMIMASPPPEESSPMMPAIDDANAGFGGFHNRRTSMHELPQPPRMEGGSFGSMLAILPHHSLKQSDFGTSNSMLESIGALPNGGMADMAMSMSERPEDYAEFAEFLRSSPAHQGGF